MNECTFTFSLELQYHHVHTANTTPLYSRFLPTWGQESCQSTNGNGMNECTFTFSLELQYHHVHTANTTPLYSRFLPTWGQERLDCF
uniref:Uncharacterized protein n=1 Tax=Sinocyclocheilus grahami TaxID=75366 RepID=A0A672QYL4_SINGR